MSVTYKLLMLGVAIIVVSIVAGLSFAALPMLLAPSSTADPSLTIQLAAGAAFFAIPVAAVSGLFVGLPIAFALRTLKLRGFAIWGLAGAIAGGVVSFLIATLLSGGFPLDISAEGFLVWVAMGFLPGLAAGLFWWRAVAQFELAAL